MLEEGAEMVGNLFLLLAMVLHARYVILDAEGLLPRPEVDEEGEPDEEEAYAEEETYDEEELAAEEAILFGQSVRVSPPHGSKKKPRAANTSKPDAFSAGMEAAETRVGRKLTSQEKKALRRRLEKQRRERRSA